MILSSIEGMPGFWMHSFVVMKLIAGLTHLPAVTGRLVVALLSLVSVALLLRRFGRASAREATASRAPAHTQGAAQQPAAHSGVHLCTLHCLARPSSQHFDRPQGCQDGENAASYSMDSMFVALQALRERRQSSPLDLAGDPRGPSDRAIA